MQRPDESTLAYLLKEHGWPTISVYMPISKTGDQQDAIRFKNLLGEVESQLVEGGLRPVEAQKIVEKELALVQDVDFWKHAGGDGLAVFLGGDNTKRFVLPINFQEMIQVGKRFFIKPLIPLFEDREYLLLGLNRGAVRLFRGDRLGLTEIGLPDGVPDGLEEVLEHDDPEKQLQYHANSSAQGGKPAAMYHGQGVGIDEDESNLKRYCQALDRPLSTFFEAEKLPVILGASAELQGVYRQISKSNYLLSEGIDKNINDLSEEQRHLQSWEIAAEYYQREENEFEQGFVEKLGKGLAVDDLREVVEAAFYGRVDVLFAAIDQQVWGVFDNEKLEIMIVERNEAPTMDLIDEAVYWTLVKGGRVFLRQREAMVSDADVGALLRF